MAVTVKWERADQRRHLSVTAPLLVSIDGREQRATRWSLGHVERVKIRYVDSRRVTLVEVMKKCKFPVYLFGEEHPVFLPLARAREV